MSAGPLKDQTKAKPPAAGPRWPRSEAGLGLVLAFAATYVSGRGYRPDGIVAIVAGLALWVHGLSRLP